VRRPSQAVPPAASTGTPASPPHERFARNDSFDESAAAPAAAAVEPEAEPDESADKPAGTANPDGGFRRSAMAELTAIATLTDDFTYRRR
jgi:hypothetical protein